MKRGLVKRMDELARCRSDPAYCIDGFCQIRHPLHGLIPFKLWDWQRELLSTFQQQNRIIILKARQLGASELVAAYALWVARFTPGALVLFISRNQVEASELLDRAATMHDNWPDWLRCPLIERRHGKLIVPATETVSVIRQTSRILEFSHSDGVRLVRSRIESLPATRSTGRARAVTLAILDEWAHQPWQDAIWTSMQPTVANGGSLIGISTANGVGNRFYQLWEGAVTGKNGFTPIFLPWSANPERSEAWYDTQQQALELWQLHQEYPAQAMEAFIQSGRPVFAHDYLQHHLNRITNDSPPLLIDNGLTIWQEAIGADPHRYIIGADVAEGLEHGDWSAACVIDRITGCQVAALYGHWEPDLFAEHLVMLGERYGDAELAVERNNHGHAVLAVLSRRGYPNIYRYSDALRDGNENGGRAGWPTTAQTKVQIIASLIQGLRESAYLPADPQFITEASTYSYHDHGAMSAPNGKHDDRVIAHALAWHLANQPDMVAQTMAIFTDLAHHHQSNQ